MMIVIAYLILSTISFIWVWVIYRKETEKNKRDLPSVRTLHIGKR